MTRSNISFSSDSQIFIIAIEIEHFRPLIEITTYLGDIYKCNSKTSSRYCVLCDRYATLLKTILKIFIPALFSICGLMMAVPIVEYYATGRVVPSSGVYFPGITNYDGKLVALLFIYNNMMILGAIGVHPPIILLSYLVFVKVLICCRACWYLRLRSWKRCWRIVKGPRPRVGSWLTLSKCILESISKTYIYSCC